MAIAPCKECGNDVSTSARNCPHCGKAHPTGPGFVTLAKWLLTIPILVIVWIFFWAIGTAMGQLKPTPSYTLASSTITPDATVAPAYSVEVISSECLNVYGRGEAKVAVRNTGTDAIPVAQAFYKFIDRAGHTVDTERTYFSPMTIPPGAIATATLYASEDVHAQKCGPLAFQDGSGNLIKITP